MPAYLYGQPIEAQLEKSMSIKQRLSHQNKKFLAIVNLPDPQYYSIYERLKIMRTTSKEGSENPGREMLDTQDGREMILDELKKDDTAKRFMNLALVFDDQGHPKLAEEAYKQMIQKRKETPIQKDQVIVFCQRKISSILRQRGLYSRAEEECKSVLDISIEYTGPFSKFSLLAAGDLALVWRDQGNFDDAFTKILEILDNESCSPYQDAMHVRLVIILAIILRDCGHYDMSLFLTKNALRVSDELFGNENPFTLDLASELSQTLTEMGNHRLAEAFAGRALDGLAKTFGTDHPQSLKAASRLANAMRFGGRLGNATELFERTLEAQKLQLGYNHPDTVPTKRGLAATYALKARYRDSALIVRQILAQKNLRKSQEDTDWTPNALENILAIQKALSTDSKPQNEMEEEIHRMEDFFTKPFRNDERNLRLCDAITFSQKNTEDLRSHSDRQRLEAARCVLTGVRNGLSSSIDQTSVSGIYGNIMHAACIEGNLESVQRWLNPRNINVECGVFGSPLCAASYGGHIHIVNLLLENDADVNKYGDHGFSALQLALSMGHNDLARTLLRAGANDEMSDRWYGTALHEASMAGQESTVDLLLETKVQPNAVTGIFGTALAAAAWKGNLAIVHALIHKGAIVDTQDVGKMAIDFAASGAPQDNIMEALMGAAANGKEVLKPEDTSETLEQKVHGQDRSLVEELKPKDQSEPFEQEFHEQDKPLVEDSIPKEKSEALGQKFQEQDKPLVEDLKPKEQSKPLEERPLKRPKPMEPPMQKLTNRSDPNNFRRSLSIRGRKLRAGKKKAEKTQTGKTPVGKNKARLENLTKKFTSATKSLIPSSGHRS